MSSNIQFKFSCPKCGTKIFETANPKALSAFRNTVCTKCGTKFTENEIKTQAAKYAEKLAADFLRFS